MNMFMQSLLQLTKEKLVNATAKGLQLEADLVLKQWQISENNRYLEYLNDEVKRLTEIETKIETKIENQEQQEDKDKDGVE